MRCLLAQAQLLDQRGVTAEVLALEVVEQLAATADHAQQAATTVVVLLVGLEVGGQLVDASGQQGDLHLGGASVVGATGVVLDDGCCVEVCDGHGVFPKNMQAVGTRHSPACDRFLR